MGSTGSARTYLNITAGQRAFEEQYRNADREHIGFFDKDGNLLFEASGRYDAVDIEASGPFNHNVEQRIWNNEEVNQTHNHPYESIFSTNDVQSFEEMEAHSITATAPSGRNFRLIREQPITQNIWTYDSKTDEFKNIGFTPKKIAPAYDAEYSKVYDSRYSENRRLWTSGKITTAEYERRDKQLIDDTTKHMVAWLRKNARNYGYRFIED